MPGFWDANSVCRCVLLIESLPQLLFAPFLTCGCWFFFSPSCQVLHIFLEISQKYGLASVFLYPVLCLSIFFYGVFETQKIINYDYCVFKVVVFLKINFLYFFLFLFLL